LWLAYSCAPRQRYPVNALSACVAMFCAWLLFDALFLTPRYTADSLYRPLALWGGFTAAAVVERDAQDRMLRAAAALVAVLVLIGLLQAWFGIWSEDPGSKRAAATFATANTFATVINLLLLPCVALALDGRGGRFVYVAAFWFFAGLLATESRGGWLAFLTGLLFISLYRGLSPTPEVRARWLRMVAGLLWTFIAFHGMRALIAALPTGGAGAPSIGRMLAEDIAARGTSYRIDLAAVALSQIAERPFAGAGANTFWPLYEMAKPPALDMGVTFPFVHNDYLQTWLEFGLPGIVLLCAVIAAGLAIVLEGRRAQSGNGVLCACGAASAGFFAHAAVDFPLYVPFPLLVIGAWLGALAASRGDAAWAAGAPARLADRLQPRRALLLSAVVAFAALVWLAQPVIAEFAARHALSELFAGRALQGVYWQTVARRLEPRSGRRCWEEGVIWRDQALETGDKEFAANADAAFSQGMLVDPYDVNNFVERARFHREHRQLLAQPASPEEILAWSAHVLGVRPYVLASQAEYARSLAFAGRTDEARRLAKAMAGQHPDSPVVRRLAAEL
jgi:O-antigen ligase